MPEVDRYPRTAEDIIRDGDLRDCYIRELLDLAREMGIAVPNQWREAIRLIEAEARRRGWLQSAGAS
jgi:uncharacterized membrane protein